MYMYIHILQRRRRVMKSGGEQGFSSRAPQNFKLINIHIAYQVMSTSSALQACMQYAPDQIH